MKGQKNSQMGEARQVIIGNSAAALAAIKGIREVDRFCPITVISAENCNAYSPVLTTYYLKGRISKKDLFVVDSSFYELKDIRTIFGRKAVEVDTLRQRVYLDNDGYVLYDNLLIATGASPVKLGGSEKLDNVFSLRTIEDTEKILERARRAKDIVLIGAGLISLQIGDALFKEGINLTIVEQAHQVLPETTDEDCAAIAQKEIESHGISLLLGEKVQAVRQKGSKAIVVPDSGKELIADMVIVGIGVKPNVGMVKNSGIQTDRGILVDDTLRTNISNVFAAGDVSQGKNMVTCERELLPNWINACKQGRIAGLNMAGSQEEYEGGLRETITTIFGLTIVAVGLCRASNSGEEELKFVNSDRKVYRKLILSDNKVVGSLLMGSIKDAGILKYFISNRKDFSTLKEKSAIVPIDIRQTLLSITCGRDLRFILS